MATMKCDVVSVTDCLFSGEIQMLSARGVAGELGILPGHIPLTTLLYPGSVVRLKTTNGSEEHIVVLGGVLVVQQNNQRTHVTVLADSAIFAAELTKEQKEEALKTVNEKMRDQKDMVDIAKARKELAASIGLLEQHKIKKSV